MLIGEGDSPRRWRREQSADRTRRSRQGRRAGRRASAPAQLLRRLRQVGVVDQDRGECSRLGSGWSRAMGGCAVGMGSLQKYPAPQPQSVCCAPTASQRWRQNFRLWSTRLRQLPRSGDGALAQMERYRSEAEQARNAALTAEREARDATRAGDAASAALERIEEQRAGLTQRQADLEPVLEAAREAVSAAEHSLATLPDPTVLEHDVDAARDAAASAASAVADKRAAAATKARETAADRERLSAASRDQGDWRKRQADAEKRLAGAREREQLQFAERAELAKEPAELDRQIATLERANGREPGKRRRSVVSRARRRGGCGCCGC